MADPTYIYVDSIDGNDSGGGGLNDPYQNIDFAFSKLGRTANGQVLRLRSGRAFRPHVAGQGIRQLYVRNVIIEPYWRTGDQTDNPVIDGVTYLPPNETVWTLEGPNTAQDGFIWSIQLGTSQSVRRVFAGSIASSLLLPQRVLGEGLRRAPNESKGSSTGTVDTLVSIKAALNENDAWYPAGSGLTYKLYVWTRSSTQDPSVYYQGLAIVQNGAGTMGMGGMAFYWTKNTVVRNIDVTGPASWSYQIASTDNEALTTEDVLFENCYSKAALNHFKVGQVSTLGYGTVLKRINFRNCTADTWTSPREQEPSVAYSKLAESDQFYFSNGCEDVVAIDCVSINPTHSAVSVAGYDAVHAKPRRSGFLRHKSTSAPWVAYSRAAGMDNCESSCFIKESTFIGQNVQSQFSGGGQVVGNKWLGLRPAIRKTYTGPEATDGWIAFDCYRTNLDNPNVGNDKYVDLRPENFVFANNTCDGSHGTPIQMFIYTPSNVATKPQASVPDNSLLVANNLLIDTKPGRAGKAYLRSFQNGGYTVGVQNFENNAIYNGTNTPSSVHWNGVNYPSLHSAPGHRNNLTVAPQVDADLRPKNGSPLLQSGRYYGAARDNTGKRYGLRPTIGAHEVDGPVRRQPRTVIA